MRTIQVTDEEYEYLMRLRQELQRRKAVGEKVDDLPGGRKSAEFAMGAVAGIAAYWVYKELMEDEDEDEEPDDVGSRRRGPRGRRRP
jgi:hypothetical protein